MDGVQTLRRPLAPVYTLNIDLAWTWPGACIDACNACLRVCQRAPSSSRPSDYSCIIVLCGRERADEAKLIVITVAENGVIVIARLSRVPEAQRNVHNKSAGLDSMLDLFIDGLMRVGRRCD